jgi:hypothetical protein
MEAEWSRCPRITHVLERQQHERVPLSLSRRRVGMQLWMAWLSDLGQKGHIKDPGQPLEHTGKVVTGQAKTVTDGPYAEAKDLVGGYTIVEAKDIHQAADFRAGARSSALGGAVEIRPVMKM